MLFEHAQPHAFRELRVGSDQAAASTKVALAAVDRRAARSPGLQAWAVHRSAEGGRVVVVERWRDMQAFLADADAGAPGAALYAWAGTGGLSPTPVADPDAGVIVIDLFPVWRPLVRPVAAFNLRNGEAFNREPGCISTTVFRGLTVGGIATYARWRSTADFAAAFARITGKSATTTDDVNAAARRMTRGLIRPDYHAYHLVAIGGDAR